MWAVAQVAALHSPSDTVVSVLLGSEPSSDWDWVKWLPHARNDDGHPRPVRLATDDENRSAAISELMGEMEARRELGEKDIAGLTRWIVVLDGAREIRMSTGMVSLLKEGPRLGIFFICLDRTVRELPEECRTVVSYVGGGSSTWRSTSSATSTPYAPTWSAASGSTGCPGRWPRSRTSRPRTSPRRCPARAGC